MLFSIIFDFTNYFKSSAECTYLIPFQQLVLEDKITPTDIPKALI